MKPDTLFRQLLTDEAAQDLVEYSLLLAFLALATVALISALTSGGITNVFVRIGSALSSSSGS